MSSTNIITASVIANLFDKFPNHKVVLLREDNLWKVLRNGEDIFTWDPAKESLDEAYDAWLLENSKALDKRHSVSDTEIKQQPTGGMMPRDNEVENVANETIDEKTAIEVIADFVRHIAVLPVMLTPAYGMRYVFDGSWPYVGFETIFAGDDGFRRIRNEEHANKVLEDRLNIIGGKVTSILSRIEAPCDIPTESRLVFPLSTQSVFVNKKMLHDAINLFSIGYGGTVKLYMRKEATGAHVYVAAVYPDGREVSTVLVPPVNVEVARTVKGDYFVEVATTIMPGQMNEFIGKLLLTPEEWLYALFRVYRPGWLA